MADGALPCLAGKQIDREDKPALFAAPHDRCLRNDKLGAFGDGSLCKVGKRNVEELGHDIARLAHTQIHTLDLLGSGFLDAKLLPFLKPHGRILLAISGLTHDCHDDIPPELLVSWTPEQLDYMHDMTWWRGIFEQSTGARILDMWEMQTNEEAWADWLACDNPYAVGDRASMEAGAGKYLNFIGVVLEKL